MSNQDQMFLGRGWSFPPTFESAGRNVSLVSDTEDIRQSLAILLSTVPGERVMQPTFGCGLKKLVFESFNESTVTEIIDVVKRAILFFETRIKVENIEVEAEDYYEGLLKINIEYFIRRTNTRSNMVFPFYFKEGTNLALG